MNCCEQCGPTDHPLNTYGVCTECAEHESDSVSVQGYGEIPDLFQE